MTTDLQSYQNNLNVLLEQGQTLALASLNQDGEPEASSTPYIFHAQAFWIFVSQLSSHTQNLLQHKKASILISEANSQNIFAATRASLQCKVSIAEEHERETVLDIMTDHLGDTVMMLRQLPDFYLLKLEAQSGRFIAGFGQAFTITFPGLELSHINPANN